MGFFIVFEGGEGSGKTTHLITLREALKERGYSVFNSREPGGNYLANQIRAMLLDPENENMCVETEMMLLMAARAQHTRELIIPTLKKTDFFLCDRYKLSSVAYQGYGRGYLKEVKSFNEFATGGLNPDLTFVIDVPPKKGLEQLTIGEFEDKDRFEALDLDYHTRVNNGFLKEAALAPERIKVIPYIANGVQEMHEKILAYVLDLVKS